MLWVQYFSMTYISQVSSLIFWRKSWTPWHVEYLVLLKGLLSVLRFFLWTCALSLNKCNFRGSISGWKVVWVSLHHGSVMQSQTLSQMPRTFISCGLASTIPRERLYLMSCTMSYLKDIFVLTAVLRLLPVFIMSCRLLNLRRPLNAGLLRRCLALLLIMYYCLNGLTVRRFHFHHGLRRTPVRQRVV